MSIIRDAFLAGFRASGEGWNGEYPFEGILDSRVWEDLEEEFQEWLRERHKK